MPQMACFEMASPALKEILVKLNSAEKPMEIDHHLHEFGSAEYHIQSSASENHAYLSISTLPLSQGMLLSHELPNYTMEMVKEICPDVVEIVEPPREGYQLTLRLDFAKIPPGKDSVKMITKISTVQSVILSSQLKSMLRNVSSRDVSQGMYKPIKLIYHPREPFFVIKQPAKITAIFPMRFKENSDVIIATAFFQELMDVGSSEAWAKAPLCTWSPIPPPELRGELLEDLSTNGGYDVLQIVVDNLAVDFLLKAGKIVKQCTRGFIQRRMRKRLASLVEVLQEASIEEDQHIMKVKGCRYVRKLVSFPKSKIFKQRCDFTSKIKRIRSRIKIHGFSYFRRRWLTIPKFSSAMKYTKLD